MDLDDTRANPPLPNLIHVVLTDLVENPRSNTLPEQNKGGILIGRLLSSSPETSAFVCTGVWGWHRAESGVHRI